MFKHINEPLVINVSTASTGDIVQEPQYNIWDEFKEFKFQAEVTDYNPGSTEFDLRPNEVEEFSNLIEDNKPKPEPIQNEEFIPKETLVNQETEKLPKNFNVEKNFARIFRDDFDKLDQWIQYFCENSEHVYDYNSEYFNNWTTLFWHVKYYVNNLDWASISKMKKRGEFKRTFDFSEDQSPVKQVLFHLVEAYFQSDLPKIAIQQSNKMKQKTKDDLLGNMNKYADLLLGKNHKKAIH